jgi:hypothetical protein
MYDKNPDLQNLINTIIVSEDRENRMKIGILGLALMSVLPDEELSLALLGLSKGLKDAGIQH